MLSVLREAAWAFDDHIAVGDRPRVRCGQPRDRKGLYREDDNVGADRSSTMTSVFVKSEQHQGGRRGGPLVFALLFLWPLLCVHGVGNAPAGFGPETGHTKVGKSQDEENPATKPLEAGPEGTQEESRLLGHPGMNLHAAADAVMQSFHGDTSKSLTTADKSPLEQRRTTPSRARRLCSLPEPQGGEHGVPSTESFAPNESHDDEGTDEWPAGATPLEARTPGDLPDLESTTEHEQRQKQLPQRQRGVDEGIRGKTGKEGSQDVVSWAKDFSQEETKAQSEEGATEFASREAQQRFAASPTTEDVAASKSGPLPGNGSLVATGKTPTRDDQESAHKTLSRAADGDGDFSSGDDGVSSSCSDYQESLTQSSATASVHVEGPSGVPSSVPSSEHDDASLDNEEADEVVDSITPSTASLFSVNRQEQHRGADSGSSFLRDQNVAATACSHHSDDVWSPLTERASHGDHSTSVPYAEYDADSGVDGRRHVGLAVDAVSRTVEGQGQLPQAPASSSGGDTATTGFGARGRSFSESEGQKVHRWILPASVFSRAGSDSSSTSFSSSDEEDVADRVVADGDTEEMQTETAQDRTLSWLSDVLESFSRAAAASNAGGGGPRDEGCLPGNGAPDLGTSDEASFADLAPSASHSRHGAGPLSPTGFTLPFFPADYPGDVPRDSPPTPEYSRFTDGGAGVRGVSSAVPNGGGATSNAGVSGVPIHGENMDNSAGLEQQFIPGETSFYPAATSVSQQPQAHQSELQNGFAENANYLNFLGWQQVPGGGLPSPGSGAPDGDLCSIGSPFSVHFSDEEIRASLESLLENHHNGEQVTSSDSVGTTRSSPEAVVPSPTSSCSAAHSSSDTSATAATSELSLGDSFHFAAAPPSRAEAAAAVVRATPVFLTPEPPVQQNVATASLPGTHAAQGSFYNGSTPTGGFASATLVAGGGAQHNGTRTVENGRFFLAGTSGEFGNWSLPLYGVPATAPSHYLVPQLPLVTATPAAAVGAPPSNPAAATALEQCANDITVAASALVEASAALQRALLSLATTAGLHRCARELSTRASLPSHSQSVADSSCNSPGKSGPQATQNPPQQETSSVASGSCAGTTADGASSSCPAAAASQHLGPPPQQQVSSSSSAGSCRSSSTDPAAGGGDRNDVPAAAAAAGPPPREQLSVEADAASPPDGQKASGTGHPVNLLKGVSARSCRPSTALETLCDAAVTQAYESQIKRHEMEEAARQLLTHASLKSTACRRIVSRAQRSTTVLMDWILLCMTATRALACSKDICSFSKEEVRALLERAASGRLSPAERCRAALGVVYLHLAACATAPEAADDLQCAVWRATPLIKKLAAEASDNDCVQAVAAECQRCERLHSTLLTHSPLRMPYLCCDHVDLFKCFTAWSLRVGFGWMQNRVCMAAVLRRCSAILKPRLVKLLSTSSRWTRYMNAGVSLSSKLGRRIFLRILRTLRKRGCLSLTSDVAKLQEFAEATGDAAVETAPVHPLLRTFVLASSAARADGRSGGSGNGGDEVQEESGGVTSGDEAQEECSGVASTGSDDTAVTRQQRVGSGLRAGADTQTAVGDAAPPNTCIGHSAVCSCSVSERLLLPDATLWKDAWEIVKNDAEVEPSAYTLRGAAGVALAYCCGGPVAAVDASIDAAEATAHEQTYKFRFGGPWWLNLTRRSGRTPTRTPLSCFCPSLAEVVGEACAEGLTSVVEKFFAVFFCDGKDTQGLLGRAVPVVVPGRVCGRRRGADDTFAASSHPPASPSSSTDSAAASASSLCALERRSTLSDGPVYLTSTSRSADTGHHTQLPHANAAPASAAPAPASATLAAGSIDVSTTSPSVDTGHQTQLPHASAAPAADALAAARPAPASPASASAAPAAAPPPAAPPPAAAPAAAGGVADINENVVAAPGALLSASGPSLLRVGTKIARRKKKKRASLQMLRAKTEQRQQQLRLAPTGGASSSSSRHAGTAALPSIPRNSSEEDDASRASPLTVAGEAAERQRGALSTTDAAADLDGDRNASAAKKQKLSLPEDGQLQLVKGTLLQKGGRQLRRSGRLRRADLDGDRSASATKKQKFSLPDDGEHKLVNDTLLREGGRQLRTSARLRQPQAKEEHRTDTGVCGSRATGATPRRLAAVAEEGPPPPAAPILGARWRKGTMTTKEEKEDPQQLFRHATAEEEPGRVAAAAAVGASPGDSVSTAAAATATNGVTADRLWHPTAVRVKKAAAASFLAVGGPYSAREQSVQQEAADTRWQPVPAAGRSFVYREVVLPPPPPPARPLSPLQKTMQESSSLVEQERQTPSSSSGSDSSSSSKRNGARSSVEAGGISSSKGRSTRNSSSSSGGVGGTEEENRNKIATLDAVPAVAAARVLLSTLEPLQQQVFPVGLPERYLTTSVAHRELNQQQQGTPEQMEQQAKQAAAGPQPRSHEQREKEETREEPKFYYVRVLGRLDARKAAAHIRKIENVDFDEEGGPTSSAFALLSPPQRPRQPETSSRGASSKSSIPLPHSATAAALLSSKNSRQQLQHSGTAQRDAAPGAADVPDIVQRETSEQKQHEPKKQKPQELKKQQQQEPKKQQQQEPKKQQQEEGKPLQGEVPLGESETSAEKGLVTTSGTAKLRGGRKDVAAVGGSKTNSTGQAGGAAAAAAAKNASQQLLALLLQEKALHAAEDVCIALYVQPPTAVSSPTSFEATAAHSGFSWDSGNNHRGVDRENISREDSSRSRKSGMANARELQSALEGSDGRESEGRQLLSAAVPEDDKAHAEMVNLVNFSEDGLPQSCEEAFERYDAQQQASLKEQLQHWAEGLQTKQQQQQHKTQKAPSTVVCISPTETLRAFYDSNSLQQYVTFPVPAALVDQILERYPLQGWSPAFGRDPAAAAAALPSTGEAQGGAAEALQELPRRPDETARDERHHKDEEPQPRRQTQQLPALAATTAAVQPESWTAATIPSLSSFVTRRLAAVEDLVSSRREKSFSAVHSLPGNDATPAAATAAAAGASPAGVAAALSAAPAATGGKSRATAARVGVCFRAGRAAAPRNVSKQERHPAAAAENRGAASHRPTQQGATEEHATRDDEPAAAPIEVGEVVFHVLPSLLEPRATAVGGEGAAAAAANEAVVEAAAPAARQQPDQVKKANTAFGEGQAAPSGAAAAGPSKKTATARSEGAAAATLRPGTARVADDAAAPGSSEEDEKDQGHNGGETPQQLKTTEEENTAQEEDGEKKQSRSLAATQSAAAGENTADAKAGAATVPKESIYTRRFIVAGWDYVKEIAGNHLTEFNRLVLKVAGPTSSTPCAGFWEDRAFMGAAPVAVGPPPSPTPAASTLFDGFHALRFELRERYSEESVNSLYDGGYVPPSHLRTVVCFYGNDALPNGDLVAEVVFTMDAKEAIAVVLFVLCLVMAIPICCAVTISCHAFKHRKLRKNLRRFHLVQQRDTIEMHLRDELGVGPEEEEENEGDAGEEEEDDVCAPELTATETRCLQSTAF